ncbi:MAG: glycosyl hydrolase family 2, partial [Tannerella sp.]|nr:glycosyl hydrolase family 2 [Tannerella sp.]
MKKSVSSFLTFLFAVACVHAQEWPAVRPEARPGTRWWWPGNAVDTTNLTHNLEKYAEAGIGSVEITPIYGVRGNEANELKYLSPAWMQVLQHTLDEGKRLNIEIDMNTGTGWPFGGPDVSIDDAATRALFREYGLSEGEKLSMRIEPEEEKQRPVAKLSRLMAYSGTGQTLNLTGRVKDGYLQWTAPEGRWRLIALFEGKTFQAVKRAAPGGEGYVMDHFSAKAVGKYLAGFDRAFSANETSRPQVFFNDSYEVYGADWTPGLPEEFERRRGYRLEDHFPAFLDTSRTDGKRPEATARILSDYRETLSELLKENFTRKWTAWAHRHGSITRNQAHGSPGNLIDLYASVDVPECEGFGLSEFQIENLRQDSLTRHNDSDLSMLKYASSGAHIAGKPYTSSETFTWLTEHFRTSLSQCKPDVDLLFISGVNRIFFHGTPYSPRETEWPGWLFYASVNMSPTNTIWRDAPAFFEYIARCQSFLQKGRPDNDFLLYLPVYDMWNEQPGRLLAFDIHKMKERAPMFIRTVDEIMRCGYDVDYISDDFVRSTQCRDGRLVTPGGASYKALIVPAVHLMPEDLPAHLLKLAKEGADIVFMENFPQDVPGYGNMEKRRR